jgi:hypothetical protein
VVLSRICWNERYLRRCTDASVAFEPDRAGITAGATVPGIIGQVITPVETIYFPERALSHAIALLAGLRGTAVHTAGTAVRAVGHEIRTAGAADMAIGRADDLFYGCRTGLGGPWDRCRG